MINKFFFFIALVSIIFVPIARGSVDPEISWESLSTPHFEVIYDARHYLTARRYALRLELNYKLLTTYFREAPSKTIVIINDNTDMANGYASPIPYAHIMAYPVLPTEHETISEYADWPQELTLHEYAHILNFEPAHGFIGVLRSTMGTVISPTMLLPRWWHEGIAVEMETRFTSHGRLRSNYQDATIRALVKENQLSLYSIADINESTLESWPRGARPYLFGSLVMSEIQAIKGGTIQDNLLQRYSRRVPYFLNGPAEEEVGAEFEKLFTQAKAQLQEKVQKQLEIIQSTPTTSFTELGNGYLDSHSPQLSPDGRILTLIARNQWGKSGIEIFDRKNENRPFDLSKDTFSQFLSIDNAAANPSQDAPPSGNINRVAWLPDSSGFVFDQVRFTNRWSNFSDLHFYDLSTTKNRRLTRGLRLREPSVSPKGDQIAAVQMEQSDTRIVVLKIDGSNLEVVYSPTGFHKVSNPTFIDPDTLVFTERTIKGRVVLQKLHLPTKTLTPIPLNDLEQVASLDVEGKKILFVARQGGLQNLYYTEDQFKTIHRLTHTETAIFDGTIDERTGLVYATIMTGHGQQIASAPFTKNGYSTPPKQIKPLMEERYQQGLNSPPEEADLEKEFGSSIGEKKPYASLGYLRPRYWLPFIFVTDTGYGTQISTSSFDPLQKHAYSLQAGYDSYVRESTLGFNYVNMTTNWPFVLGVSSINRNQPNINYEFSAQQLNFLMMHDLRPWSDKITVGVGATGRTIRSTSTVKRVGPQFVFIYDGSGKSAFSEVPFNGYQLSFFGNHFLKNDDRSEFSRGILNATYFHSEFLPEKHIALLHAIAQQSQNTKLIAEYTPSDSFYLVQDFSAPRFVLRGYEQGYFYFWNARGLTFEYHVPMGGSRGWGTNPAFLKRTRVNFFADAMAVDGFSSDYQNEKYEYTGLNQVYRSYGLELKADFTFGYYLPATVILGICQRPDYSGPDKSSLMIGFQI